MGTVHVEAGIADVKANLSEFTRRAEAGERITITVHGAPVADLVPCENDKQTRRRAAVAAMRRRMQERPITMSDAEYQEIRVWGRA